MKIHYHHGFSWISHQVAGEAYCRCLRACGHELVDDPARADVVIVHDAPKRLRASLDKLGACFCPKIAYTAWEMPDAPAAMGYWLEPFKAVWVPSTYSREALAECHPWVKILPHVIERGLCSAQDLVRVGELIGWRDHRFTFLTVTSADDPRKNFRETAACFREVAALCPEPRPKLVVKHYTKPSHKLRSPDVIHVEERLTSGEMAALYALCDAYVALHRAEGWGLPLSEAMSQGKPVIATGWSGNMEFMAEGNSYPVAYALVSPRRTMVPGAGWFRLYPANTLWAQPNHGDAVARMLEVARHGLSADRAVNLGPSLEQFSPAAIGRRLDALLEEVAR